MSESELGARKRRREDRAYLTGEAIYTDDINVDDAVHVAVARSQHAHARLLEVDTEEAEQLDGVVAVYTAADLAASDAPGNIPISVTLPDADPSMEVNRPLATPTYPLLASDKVRYVGDPIAVVVAEDRYTAHDGADLVDADYDLLDAVTEASEAVSDDAPAVYDSVPDNVAFDWQCGTDTTEAFEAATHTVSVDLDQQRLIPNAVEPRAAIADYDDASGRLTHWRASQGTHSIRSSLSSILGMDEGDIRVRTPEVGGSFGNKSKAYPGECLVAWSALQVDRPVRWQATRSEMYLAGAHGRGHETHADLAFDDDGQFRGLRVESYATLGGYVCGPAASILTSSFTGCLSGQYDIPAIDCRVIGGFTTTGPISSYRATSQPRATLLIERLVRKAARHLDVDPVEIRRRNFVPPDAFPHETPVGTSYDSGAYEQALDRALELVEYDRQRSRQERLREDGRYLGIGVGCVMDEAGSKAPEQCTVRIDPSGTVTATTGTLDTGQGHETTFTQLLADGLGVPGDDIEIRQGDSDALPGGTGTHGSRTAVVSDTMFEVCIDDLEEQGRPIAAGELEADEEDIAFTDGEFHVRGAPQQSIPIQEVAARADGDAGLEAHAAIDGDATFPFGTHVAVVEVDERAGEVSLERYVAVDDCGTQINPTIVEGQVVGGAVQGIGEALLEGAVYYDNGTLRTGSMQGYALPRATDVPDFETDTTVTPSPRTNHGVKGIGESGTAAAPAAIANAVVDALEPFDVEEVQLPITDETVWEAVQASSG